MHACIFKHSSFIWKFNAHESIITCSYVLWTVLLLMWYHNLYHHSVVMLEMFLWWCGQYLKFFFKFYWSWCVLKRWSYCDAGLLWSIVASRQNVVRFLCILILVETYKWNCQWVPTVQGSTKKQELAMHSVLQEKKMNHLLLFFTLPVLFKVRFNEW